MLAEIAKLDAEGGASARQTASRVARITSSTPKDAASEVETAKQVAALPGIADAHARGEITNGQLGVVAAIASASSEDEALALARSATSSQLHQRAAASRGKLFEERRKAQTARYLAFKPEEDGQSTRIHGRLPFAESKELENQLRKIADRLGRCDKERPSPSARMADALLILTKGNPSQALHDHEERAKSQPQPGHSNETQHDSSHRLVIDQDEEPFPEIDVEYESFASTETDGEPSEAAISGAIIVETEKDISERNDSSRRGSRGFGQVVVQRADTRVIIHWNALTGEVNYENGPPIDHPRLMALLCDARIDIQHCDPNGLPTGLITSPYHSSWRQDRYLAFSDGPCRVPECQGIGKTQAHHIFEDWIDRVTSVQYMINFCNRCHKEHHDGTFAVGGDPEQTTTFTYKDGTVLSSTARPLPIELKPPKTNPAQQTPTTGRRKPVRYVRLGSRFDRSDNPTRALELCPGR